MASAQQNEQTIASFFAGKGLSKQTVAALLGNSQVESGFNPSAYNAGEGAIGIVQWENGRKTNLDHYAASVGKADTDLMTQLNYEWQELTGPYASTLAAAQAAPNVGSATQIIQSRYEGSTAASLPARQAAATQALGTLNGSSGSGSAWGNFINGATGGLLNGVSPGLGSAAQDANTAVGGAVSGALSGIAGDVASGVTSGLETVGKAVVPFLIDALAVIVGLVLIVVGLKMIVAAGEDDSASPKAKPAGPSKTHEAVEAAALA